MLAAVSIIAGSFGCIKIGGDSAAVQVISVADSDASTTLTSVTRAARMPSAFGRVDDSTSLAARLLMAMAAGNDAAVGGLARRTLASQSLDDTATQALVDLAAADERWRDIPESAAQLDTTGGATLLRAFAHAKPERIVFDADQVIVPLKRSRSGSPVISVEIGGRAYDFWLDTGASLTVLSSKTADEIGVRPLGGAVAQGGTSTSRTVAARAAIIPGVQVGALRVENHPAVIVDRRDLEVRLFKVYKVVSVDGILGWNFIRKFDVQLDMAAGQARLRMPPMASPGQRNLVWAGYPIVVSSGPHQEPLLLGLDTGASRTWFTPDYLATTKAVAAGERTRMVAGAGGFERAKVRVIPSTRVRVGRVELEVSGADVHDRRATSVMSLHGTIGADFLRVGVIRIDGANGVFSIAPMAAGLARGVLLPP